MKDEFHAGRKQLESLGIACHLIPRELPAQSVLSKGPSFYASLAWNLLSSWPYVVQKNNSSALRREIVNLNRSGEVDVWHCEWTPYAAPFLGHPNQPWLFVAHNIESLIWQRYAETEPNRLKKWYIRRQLTKLRRFERTAFQTARSAVVVSPEDAKLAKDWFDADSVDVVDNGVDVQYFSPDEIERDRHELLFLGSLDWRPNVDGVRQFLDKVFPRILAEGTRHETNNCGPESSGIPRRPYSGGTVQSTCKPTYPMFVLFCADAPECSSYPCESEVALG